MKAKFTLECPHVGWDREMRWGEKKKEADEKYRWRRTVAKMPHSGTEILNMCLVSSPTGFALLVCILGTMSNDFLFSVFYASWTES